MAGTVHTDFGSKILGQNASRIAQMCWGGREGQWTFQSYTAHSFSAADMIEWSPSIPWENWSQFVPRLAYNWKSLSRFTRVGWRGHCESLLMYPLCKVLLKYLWIVWYANQSYLLQYCQQKGLYKASVNIFLLFRNLTSRFTRFIGPKDYWDLSQWSTGPNLQSSSYSDCSIFDFETNHGCFHLNRKW